MIKLSYQFNNWIRLTAKTGIDSYTDQRLRYPGKGTYQSPNGNGDIFKDVIRVMESLANVQKVSVSRNKTGRQQPTHGYEKIKKISPKDGSV